MTRPSKRAPARAASSTGARSPAALRRSEARFRASFEQAAVGMAHLDAQGRWLWVNRQLCALLGYRRDEILGRSFTEYTHPDDISANLALLARLRDGEIESYAVEKRYIRKDGTAVWARVSVSPLREAGDEMDLIAVTEDITARKHAEEALRASELHFRTLLEQAPVGACMTNESGVLETVNDAACAVIGYSAHELVGRHVSAFLAEGYRRPAPLPGALHPAGVVSVQREVPILAKDGSVVTVLASTMEIAGIDGRPVRASFLVDITDRKRIEDQIAYIAHHDALTGLPNRVLFHTRLKRALRDARRGSASVALLLIDLDHFKEVNDTLGHDAGDALLRKVAARLRAVLRASDTVARLGGDEFAVLLPRTDARGAAEVAQKIMSSFTPSYLLDRRHVETSGSIGAAIYPDHAVDGSALMRYADVAMYVAKRNGGGFAVYSAESDQHSPTRLALTGELRLALAKEQLELHYQPVVELATGRAARAEALVRWQHPAHGLLRPDQFIPLAEQTGLITPLTEWVLRKAIAQCRAWHQAGLDMGVAVNLSTRNLHDQDLPETILALLHDSGVPPAYLTLEITESALMEQPAQARDVLARLKGVGARLAIDDFGTGYSSLSYLHELPVDELKIDRSFVTHMEDDGSAASIVTFIVGMTHALGLCAVVEGVETQAVWETLAALGCGYAQGYLMARPMPANEMTAWLQARSQAAA